MKTRPTPRPGPPATLCARPQHFAQRPACNAVHSTAGRCGQVALRAGKGPHSGLTLLRHSRAPIPRSPAKARLETFRNAYPQRDYWIHFECPEFTALCPVTGQPDFGAITIDYIPDRVCLESKSLKLYLFSFRNHGAFHEAAVNRILDDLVAICRPRRLRVTGRFNPRGGIAITVTAEHPAAAP